MYNDFAHDPREFAVNNVLYHYYVNHDRLIIGKYCSIACGAKFLFNSANHSLRSLSTYPFPIFYDEWELDVQRVTDAWDNKRCRTEAGLHFPASRRPISRAASRSRGNCSALCARFACSLNLAAWYLE